MEVGVYESSREVTGDDWSIQWVLQNGKAWSA